MTHSADLLENYLESVSKNTETLETPPAIEEPASDNAYPIRDIFHDLLNTILSSSELNDQQKKVASSIAMCKTEHLGLNMEYCPQCNIVRLHYRSCNNRNCPCCQYPMQQKWIMERNNEVIPEIPYYHIVLTVPHDLNPLILENPKLILGELFSCASASVIQKCLNSRVLGATPGIISVLHTWTQDLKLHYHIHMIVSGGGINKAGQFVSLTDVRSKRKRRKPGQGDDYFFDMKSLTKLFRGKMMAALKQLWAQRKLSFPQTHQYLSDLIQWDNFCQKLYEKDWVGMLKGTFNGKGNAIDYLARYTFKTAISNGRILNYDGQNVTFQTTDRKTGEKKPVTISAWEFVRRFLSHILPKGFSRVRYSGFLSNACKTKNLSRIHRLLNLAAYFPLQLNRVGKAALMKTIFGKDFSHCAKCGCLLIYWSRASPRP